MKRLLAVVVFCSICSTLARAEDAPPAADVDNSTDFVLSTLPADDAAKLPADDKDLARIAESLKSAKLAQYHKTNVRVLDKTPFVSAAEPVAVVLDSKKEQTIVGVNKSVQHVIVLFAVLDPGKDPLAQLTALRSDGVPTRTKFNPGENCGPSIGAWEGKLQPKQRGFTAKVVAEIKAKDGTPVRLFLLDWRNDNEWYPVTDLKFKLLDPKAKPRFVVLAVTCIGGVKQ